LGYNNQSIHQPREEWAYWGHFCQMEYISRYVYK